MTQNELNYMLTIAEHGNLTRAAEELFISQPSLSESLARIERELGQSIFLRTQDGMVPTEFGQLYLKTAQDILRCYRNMLTELEEYRSLNRGTISFGIPVNLGSYLLPMVLPAFHQQHPNISTLFRENNSTELTKLMLSGKLDFSVMHDEGSHRAMQYEFLADDPFYLVMPLDTAAKMKLPDYRILSLYDLKALSGEPFIMIASRQKIRLVADSILNKIGIRPEIRYTTKNMETAKRLCAAGLGVTFLPYSYLNLYSGTERLACYPLDQELQAYWQLVIAYPKNRQPSRCARVFIDQLKHKLAAV